MAPRSRSLRGLADPNGARHGIDVADLQRVDNGTLDAIRRMRGALEHGEVPAERAGVSRSLRGKSNRADFLLQKDRAPIRSCGIAEQHVFDEFTDDMGFAGANGVKRGIAVELRVRHAQPFTEIAGRQLEPQPGNVLEGNEGGLHGVGVGRLVEGLSGAANPFREFTQADAEKIGDSAGGKISHPSAEIARGGEHGLDLIEGTCARRSRRRLRGCGGLKDLEFGLNRLDDLPDSGLILAPGELHAVGLRTNAKAQSFWRARDVLKFERRRR